MNYQEIHTPLGGEEIAIEMAWVDMETTGLSTKEGDVPLEVGCILTDWDGNEAVTFKSLIVPRNWEMELANAKPIVQEMHRKNGLASDLREVCAAMGERKAEEKLSFGEVDNEMFKFLDQFGDGPSVMPMCGSTINFDRDFMTFLPNSLSWFHYRNIDVSTVMNLCRGLNKSIHDQCPGFPADKKAHRVLADIRDSIKLYKFYKDNFLFTAGEVD